MKPFSSLFAKILFWFFLNLMLIASVLVVFFTFQSQVDLRGLFGRKTSDRINTTGKLISHDLSQAPMASWPDILARYGEIHEVDFAVVFANGSHVASTPMDIPGPVKTAARSALRPKPPKGVYPPPTGPAGLQKGRKGWRGHEMQGDAIEQYGKQTPPEPRETFGKRQRLMMRTKNPTQYWIGTRIRIFPGLSRPRMTVALLAVSDAITGNGFFFDPLPWMMVTLLTVFLSVLLWIPLIRNITRPVTRMTRAAEEIAKGRFDVSINEPRADEIGRLGSAINHMTSRLRGFVEGQKRFLGDIAHELGSPIARIQVGLGILEQKSTPENRKQVADVMEDVEHMSALVHELLSFSKAEMNRTSIMLEPTALLPVVQKAVQRETRPETEIIIKIDPGLQVAAAPALLARALANIVRNAVKYAGGHGPISISAERNQGVVKIAVRDSGPGMPEEFIDQVFEPFFRPESSRARESGGVGLGLAIVKTCIETCKGSVSAQNLKPRGFEVTITLGAQ